jgi:hypothetical protein
MMNKLVALPIAGALPVALTGRGVAAAPEADPIFALIEDHRKLRTALGDMCEELDDAECEAQKEHGLRPIPLISWRDYTICGPEIETRREQLLSEAEIDPATVEQEYLDAKAREQAKLAAEKAWDVRAGLEVKREDLHRACNAESECAERLSTTKPTTPAGAAALIQHVIDDDICTGVEWHMTSLETAVAALNSMGAAV